ncbi:MAG: 50S ribosomal protein L29 [Candidatus Hadarchaeales archaeon]
MVILRASDIRAMSREEMLEKLRELRAELSRLKATIAAGGTVENPGRIREIKRTIARIITIAKEKGVG